MPSITCPKCNQSYNIDAASIGKQCECPCGHTFTAEAKSAAPIVIPANPKPASIVRRQIIVPGIAPYKRPGLCTTWQGGKREL